MAETSAGPIRWQLSMTQMMKLVVLGAVASVCLVPAYQCVELGVMTWTAFLLMEAVAIPLALALAVFPLARRGPLKDWAIRALLLSSVSVALGLAVYFMAWVLIRSSIREIAFFALDGAAIHVLGLAFVTLVRGLVPIRCPECSRRAMLPVPSTGSGMGHLYHCMSCGAGMVPPRSKGDQAGPGIEGVPLASQVPR